MTFFHPWAFGFAGLVPVVVALYLLKVRRRPVAISTLLFWQRVVQENQRRALFQRLRQWLSLLLHLLILALLVLALARPALDRTVHAGASTVLLLDTRARMQAVEADGETRFSKALRAAQGYASQAAPGRPMAICTLGATGAVRLGFSDDPQVLQETLAACTVADSTGELASAATLAADLLASRAGEKRLLVFSDRAEELVLSASAAKPEFVSVGTARPNVALTQFASRSLPASPETFEILLEVANFRAEPWSGNVEVTLDGQTLDVRPVSLAAGEKKTDVFSTVRQAARGAPSRGELVARLEGHDALPLDDVAYAVLPLAPPRRVLLVSKGNWFLEKLLAADIRLRYELLAPEDYRPEMARQFDALLLDDLPSPGQTLPPAGNFLFLKQSPFASGEPELVQPLITEADIQHPTLRLARLEHVSLARAVALQMPATPGDWHYETPLRFGDRPLLIAGERLSPDGSQRVAALAFGITDSDLPLRIAFPLLMANTIHWLAGEGPKFNEGKLSNFTGAASTKNGFQQIPQAGGGSRTVAVNTFSERESDLRLAAPASSVKLPTVPAWTRARIGPGGWPLWQYLTLAAALLLAGEWWLFHRRQTE